MAANHHGSGSTSNQMPIRTKLLILAPTILLCAIAARQFWLATTDTLSPWKGGGFGMFATNDSPGNRFVRITGFTSEGEQVRVSIGTAAIGLRPDLMDRLRSYPGEHDLQSLADALVNSTFVERTVGTLVKRDAFFQANPALATHFPGLPDRPQRELEVLDRRRVGHYDAVGERLRTVEVELWRYTFDPDDLTLRTHCIIGPIASNATSPFPSVASRANPKDGATP